MAWTSSWVKPSTKVREGLEAKHEMTLDLIHCCDGQARVDTVDVCCEPHRIDAKKVDMTQWPNLLARSLCANHGSGFNVKSSYSFTLL